MAGHTREWVRAMDRVSGFTLQVASWVGMLGLGLMLSASTVRAATIPDTLGWYEIPNTTLRPVCAGENGFPQVLGNSGCASITGAWSGGIADTKRNRLIIWGGGHNDYYGNELYALDLNNLTLTRLTDPCIPPASSGSPDGICNNTQPNSRHTYGGVAYISAADRMWARSGSMAPGGGCGSPSAMSNWTYNFAGTGSGTYWQRMGTTMAPTTETCADTSDVDPNTNLIFITTQNEFASYNYTANTEAILNPSGGTASLDMSGVVDYDRKLYITTDGSTVYSINIASGSTYAKTTHSTTGGPPIDRPGLAYDPVLKKVVAWSGGNTVYLLDTGTWSWTSVTYPGGPGPALSAGTYGRFRYFPSLGVYAVYNSVDANGYTLRLSSGTPPSDTTAPSIPLGLTASTISSSQINLSWTSSTDNVGVAHYSVERCQGAGCASFSQIATPTTNAYADAGLTASTVYQYRARAADAAGNLSGYSSIVNATTQSASSGGSDFATRCAAPGVLKCVGFDTAADVAPATWPNPGNYPIRIGQSTESPVLDSAINASGGGSLKFIIPGLTAANVGGQWRQDFGRTFGAGSTFYVQFRQRFSPEMMSIDWNGLMGTSWKQVIFHNVDATCADVELTTVRYSYTADPDFPIMYTECGNRGLYTNDGFPPMQVEQGDYNCWYGNFNATDCFVYPPNQWVTFYYRVSIGNWGQPNSTIEAWVAPDGQPYKQWVSMPNFVLNNSTPGQDYDYLTLLPYMTAKDASVNHPTAYTWYDELIVSTQPIAAPGASSGLRGDLDGNGKVDIDDLRRMIYMLVGTVPKDLATADLDGDGQLLLVDLQMLVRILVGIP